MELIQQGRKIKIPMTAVKNLSDFSEYKNVLQCYLCNHLAIAPFFCENCKNSFCRQCIDELKLNNDKCPNCMLENDELRICNEKFFEYFKDVKIECDKCKEILPYSRVISHKCFIVSDDYKPQELGNDDIKVINNTIYERCRKCNEFIEISFNQAHSFTCLGPKLTLTIPKIIEDKNPLKIEPVQPIINPQLSILPPINFIELTDNLNKFTKNLDTANITTLISAMDRLSKELGQHSKLYEPGFCHTCQIIKKNIDLSTCKTCNKIFCLNCCRPCLNCNTILSKICFITCAICKEEKCPICSFHLDTVCICINEKFCKTCFNNPLSINNLQLNMIKSQPHVNCKFFKLLDSNVYVFKIPSFDFRCDMRLNSNKQVISLSLVKGGLEIFSKLFQVNINDTIVVIKEKGQLKSGDSIDFWALDLKNIEGSADYMILNFNSNPNYAFALNKLNNTNFEELNPVSSVISSGIMPLFGPRIQSLFNNINIQRINN
jgi:hypothetical protein